MGGALIIKMNQFLGGRLVALEELELLFSLWRLLIKLIKTFSYITFNLLFIIARHHGY